jgi:hypothetical protein
MSKVKKAIEDLLRNHPRVFAFASKCYHRLNHSFKTLSPGAPGAIRQAFTKIKKSSPVSAGDYYEFGIFRGYAFLSAQNTCKELGMNDVNFYGFDSFEGLPPLQE